VLDWELTIRGYRGTRRLMRELEPELLREMDRTVKKKLEPIRVQAKRLVPGTLPLRNWKTPHNPYSQPSYSPYGRRWDYERLEWDTTMARKGIVVRQPKRRRRGQVTRSLYQLQSNNPSAAVYELMGRGKSDVNMVGNLRRKYPGTGRVLYRAFDRYGGDKIEKDVVDTVRKFEREFNRRLDAAGD